MFSTAFATMKFLFDFKPMMGGSFLLGTGSLKEPSSILQLFCLTGNKATVIFDLLEGI